MLTRLSGRYGWRGVWLIVAGTVWIMLGVGQFYFPLPDNQWVLFQQLPNAVLAAGWWSTGIVAVGQGFRSSALDDCPDTIGHVALYLMPAVRVVSYSLAWMLYVACWLLGHLPDRVTDLAGLRYGGPPAGDSTAWYSALVWLLISAMLAVAAAWPNPQPPMPLPPARLLKGDDDRPPL